MAAFTLIVVILIPMAVASVVVALLPLRPTRVRGAVLTAHVLASLALIALLDGPWELWVMVFGPGLAIAAFRLTSSGA